MHLNNILFGKTTINLFVNRIRYIYTKLLGLIIFS